MRTGPKPRPITDRLWPRVDMTGDCWLWTGAKNRTGYGVIGTGRRQKAMLAHRLVWMLCVGDPGDLHVLHSCDTPSCVRPDHLFLGTQLDNMRDMDAKRRCQRRRRLSPEQTAEILASTESSRVLAEKYPMTARGIRRLRARGGYTSPFNPRSGVYA